MSDINGYRAVGILKCGMVCASSSLPPPLSPYPFPLLLLPFLLLLLLLYSSFTFLFPIILLLLFILLLLPSFSSYSSSPPPLLFLLLLLPSSFFSFSFSFSSSSFYLPPPPFTFLLLLFFLLLLLLLLLPQWLDSWHQAWTSSVFASRCPYSLLVSSVAWQQQQGVSTDVFPSQSWSPHSLLPWTYNLFFLCYSIIRWDCMATSL